MNDYTANMTREQLLADLRSEDPEQTLELGLAEEPTSVLRAYLADPRLMYLTDAQRDARAAAMKLLYGAGTTSGGEAFRFHHMAIELGLRADELVAAGIVEDREDLD